MAGKVYLLNALQFNVFAYVNDPAANRPRQLFAEAQSGPYTPSSTPVDRANHPDEGQFGPDTPVRLTDESKSWWAEYVLSIPGADSQSNPVSVDDDLLLYLFWDSSLQIPKPMLYNTRGFHLVDATLKGHGHAT